MMSGLNVFDIVLLVIIFFSALMGLLRGFISEVISLLALIAAFMVAIYFTNALATYFTHTSSVQSIVSETTSATGISTETPVSYVAIAASFAILFCGTLIAGAIVKLILNAAFKTGILGFGNSLLGCLFGVVRGLFLCLVVVFLMQLSPFSSSTWFQQSHLAAKFQPAVVWLGNIVSPTLSDLRNKFGSTVQGLGSTVQSLSAYY